MLVWFICFGLSFLAEILGLAAQGTAFLFLWLGCSAILIALIAFLVLFPFSGRDGSEKWIGISVTLLGALTIAIRTGIVLVTTWVATKLFPVDYYVACQIMTFGLCLCSSSSK